MHQTPYFSIDLDTVTKNYRALQAALPHTKLFYALKANAEASIVRRLAACGANFEIASINELQVLLQEGISTHAVVFSNPVKIPSHIATAWELGVKTFTLDAPHEAEKLASLAPGAWVFVRLRVSDRGSTFPLSRKFGAKAEDATELIRYALRLGLRPQGLAFHVGSQCTNLSRWELAIQDVGNVMRELQAYNITLPVLNLGGGFPANYGQEAPDFETIGRIVRETIQQHIPYHVRLQAEPGRAIVAEAGTLVTSVIGEAMRDGKHWLYLDAGAFSGMIETLETSNTFPYPITTSRDTMRTTAHYTLTGPTCDPQDTLFYDIALPKGLTIGDTIRFHTAGAYTTVYASRFNGFDIPPTICFNEQKE